MIKKCDICGKEFEAKDNRTKYCSDECISEVARIRKRNYWDNMTSEQKEIESQKAKARYEKRYIKEKKKVDKRECIICKEEFTPNFNGAKTKYCSQSCADEARKISNRERWRRDNPGWDEGINKVCEWCGHAYTVPARNASQSRFCSDECGQTWYSREVRGHRSVEEYQEERELQKEERQIKEDKEREQQLSNLKCIECGSTFKGTRLNQEICSPKCRKVRMNRQQRLNKDKRINDTNNIDKDISLEVLYERDKGICYICGGKCSFDDNYEVNGYFTAGPNYPSTDHVIPLARGGMHAWDNVKLAHRHCNNMKSDILPSELGLDIDIDDAYALARKVSPRKKEVKQYSKDGKLIKTYESTAEAGRQLGIPASTIQNNARGENKAPKHGYIFEYV